MPVNTDTLNKNLYDVLNSRGYDPVSLNSKGDPTDELEKADVFRFTYDNEGKKGQAWATNEGNELVLYIDDNFTKSPDFENFTKFMKQWAQKKLLGFKITNKDHLVSDMKKRTVMKKKEELNEGYYPMGKKASYNDSIPTVKVIIQHSRQLEEGEQRFRNIARIFVENASGERFLVPTTRPGLARVYARHIAEGGTPYDDKAKHITSLVEEYTKMAGFVRATRKGQFNESALTLVNEGLKHYNGLRMTLQGMTSHRGYNNYFESYTPVLNEESTDTTSINELFVQEKLDPRIESVLPILNRLSKNITEMSEVKELESWATAVTEGEERPYFCVHVKKGEYECKASSSYEAAKKAAQHWKLKSTAGIDVHLADVTHTPVDEGFSDTEMKYSPDELEKIHAPFKAAKKDRDDKARRAEQALANYIMGKSRGNPDYERKPVTHEDPLVTVHDARGLHTHANLSTANRIFGTDVKAKDVHAGPVDTHSESGKVLTFAISQHHAREVEKVDENYRVLATKGIGAERKEDIKVGHGVDYYHPKDGSKHMGKIHSMSDKGYTVKDDKTGEKHNFQYYRNEAEQVDEVKGINSANAKSKTVTGLNNIKKHLMKTHGSGQVQFYSDDTVDHSNDETNTYKMSRDKQGNPFIRVDEAPGAETLAHNQNTAEKNLKAFGLAEGDSDDHPAVNAIINRIMRQHPDLLSHGPAKVIAAVKDVAGRLGDLQEIGSSDVSAWVKEVARNLESGEYDHLDEGSADEPEHEDRDADDKRWDDKEECPVCHKHPCECDDLDEGKLAQTLGALGLSAMGALAPANAFAADIGHADNQPVKTTPAQQQNKNQTNTDNPGMLALQFWMQDNAGKIGEKYQVSSAGELDAKTKTMIHKFNDALTNKKLTGDARKEYMDMLTIGMRYHQEPKLAKKLMNQYHINYDTGMLQHTHEGLDANQKRIGQLGPTEPVGKNEKNLRGKLVGNESVEMDRIKTLSGIK